VGFSIRDEQSAFGLLRNQRGQAIIEYILILVVTVALILGGMYQLNTAFKSWANNYFGNYLACLLETGELPTISGSGGDAGLCNEIFKPFTLADGRPLVSGYTPPEGGGGGNSGGGAREGGRPGASRAGGGGGGGSYGGRPFPSSFGKGSRKTPGQAGGKKGASATYTGSMAASDYGSGAGGSRNKINMGVKGRLDNRFAFQDERERPQKRSVAGSTRKPGETGEKAPRTRVKRSEVKKSDAAEADTGLNLPNFIRILIIAGIVIALVMFLGGQALQIGKSMD